MDKNKVKEIVESVIKSSKKRDFKQTFDLIINLKGLDLKKPEHKVDLFVELPFGKGKKTKVCALVGDALFSAAKEACDKVILKEEFANYDKKAQKKLAREYNYFIGQADVMTNIAFSFGKVFGPKGKIPNPKAGCILPPKAVVKAVYEKLQNLVRLVTNNELAVKCLVGREGMDAESIAGNIISVYNALLHALPEREGNIKSVLLKLTMGSPVELGK